MGTMTKWPVQKHTEHHKTRSIQRRNRHKEIIFFEFSIFLIFLFNFQLLKGLLQKILNYRLKLRFRKTGMLLAFFGWSCRYVVSSQGLIVGPHRGILMSVLQPGLCLPGYSWSEGEISPWLLTERCISEGGSLCPTVVPTWQGSLGQLEVAAGPGWT